MDWKREVSSNASSIYEAGVRFTTLCMHRNLLRKQVPRKELLELASTTALIQ